MESMPRICEFVVAIKGGHFDEWKIQEVFCLFFIFNVAQEDLY